MRAAFAIGLLVQIALAKKNKNCCLTTPFDTCGDCTAYSTSDWCNTSADNCASCGHWCGKSDDDDSGDDHGMGALQVTELVEGVLVGALAVEHVDSLDTCIKDVNPLVTHMEAAVEDFEDGSFSKIAAGIDELG